MQPVDEARRERDAQRWALSDIEYLEQYGVPALLHSALRHVAARACLNAHLKPIDALTDYFRRGARLRCVCGEKEEGGERG